MQQFFTSLVAILRNLSQRRATPRAQQHVQLHLESMEDRLVPSTVVPKFAIPLTVPGLTAAAVPDTAATGGQPVAEPERPVHGYKWRPWWPRTQVVSSEFLVKQPSALAELKGHSTEVAQVSHLLVGGGDGLMASLGSAGHIGVRPPEGPLPLDVAFGKR